MLKISIIAAIQEKDRGIGYQNRLLFRISEDLKRFKALTLNHPVIMGRKTFESLGKALPERTNIVLSRRKIIGQNIIVVQSVDEAINKARKISDEIFIMGGGEIYTQFLPLANQLYLTIVKSIFEADSFFPPSPEFKKIISEEKHFDKKTGLEYSFVTLGK